MPDPPDASGKTLRPIQREMADLSGRAKPVLSPSERANAAEEQKNGSDDTIVRPISWLVQGCGEWCRQSLWLAVPRGNVSCQSALRVK